MAAPSEKRDAPSKATISPGLLGPMLKSIVRPKPLPDYDSTTTQSGSNKEQDDSATSGHRFTTTDYDQTTDSEVVTRAPYAYFNGKLLYTKSNGMPERRTKEELDEMIDAVQNLLSEREKVGAYKFDRYFLKHWKDYPGSDTGILGAVIKEYTADMDLDSETSEFDDEEDDMKSEEEDREESEDVAEQGEVHDTTDYVQTTTGDI
jgi:hypothetical protein